MILKKGFCYEKLSGYKLRNLEAIMSYCNTRFLGGNSRILQKGSKKSLHLSVNEMPVLKDITPEQTFYRKFQIFLALSVNTYYDDHFIRAKFKLCAICSVQLND